ncbi:Lamin Tail Domain protein [uncultured archaeon]|nr:Lamin Tail Domain protein [uncultured archaeon]
MNLTSVDAIKAFLVFFGLVALCGPALGDVVINEAELRAPDNGTVWVELYNSGPDAVDLSGWTVKIEDKPWAGLISLGGAISPGQFYVAEGQPSWITSGNGTVYLLNGKGIVMDKTPEMSDKGQSDFTYGRFPDGRKTDARSDFFFMMGSKGQPNHI